MSHTIIYLILGIAFTTRGLFGEKFYAKAMGLNVAVPVTRWRIWFLIWGALLLLAALPGRETPELHYDAGRLVFLALSLLAFFGGVFAMLVAGGLTLGTGAKTDPRTRLFGLGAFLVGGSLIWYALATWAVHSGQILS